MRVCVIYRQRWLVPNSMLSSRINHNISSHFRWRYRRAIISHLSSIARETIILGVGVAKAFLRFRMFWLKGKTGNTSNHRNNRPKDAHICLLAYLTAGCAPFLFVVVGLHDIRAIYHFYGKVDQKKVQWRGIEIECWLHYFQMRKSKIYNRHNLLLSVWIT